MIILGVKAITKEVAMLYFRVIFIVFLLLLTADCTTQKAIKETGKEIDKGNYGVATWYVVSLPVAMIYDVFTLGGTSDVSTGYNTVASVANAQSNKNKIVTPGTSTSTSVGSSPTSTTGLSSIGTSMVSAGNGTMRPVTSSTNPGSSVSNSNGTGTSGSNTIYGEKTAPRVNECLSWKRKDKWSINFTNSCNFNINIAYCYTKSETSEHPVCGTWEMGRGLNAAGINGSSVNVGAPQIDTTVIATACKAYKGTYSITYIKWNGSGFGGNCIST